MGVPPSGGVNVGGGFAGVGDLCIPPLEYSCTVHCNQPHYGPVSGGGEASGVMGLQVVVESGRIGLGGGVDSGSGGRAGVEGGGDGWYRYGKIISWGDTVSNLILGAEHNSPLSYDPVLEIFHPIISIIGGHGGQL